MTHSARLLARPGFAILAVLAAGCSGPAVEEAENEYREQVIRGRPTLVVSVTDDTTAEFAFKVAGVPFVVGNDRLHTILEGDLVVRDELWDGFGFYSVLPDVSAFTEGDVYLFGRPSTESNFIHVTVERFCPTFRKQDDCDAARAYSQILSSYADLSPKWPVQAVVGLTPIRQRLGPSDDPTRPVPWDDIYSVDSISNIGRDGSISCDRPERLPVPHCEHQFIWRDVLRIKLTYKRNNVHEWAEIFAKSIQVLEQLANRKPGTDGIKTVYFPKDYYQAP